MASFDLQLDGPCAEIIYRLLGTVDGCGRLDDALDQDRHPVGNAAVDAAVVIGRGADTALFAAEGVVGFTATQVRKSKSKAELYAFDGRHAEEQMAQHAFDRVEEWLADPGGQAADGSLEDAADAVSALCRRG